MSAAIDIEMVQADGAEMLSWLHRQAFGDPWPASAFEDLLESPNRFACLGRVGFDTVGFLLAQMTANEAEIVTFGIVPNHRRKGYGAALLRAASTYAAGLNAQTIVLEVATSNVAAINLYKVIGFNLVGRRSGYYKKPQGERDALIMRCNLSCLHCG